MNLCQGQVFPMAFSQTNRYEGFLGFLMGFQGGFKFLGVAEIRLDKVCADQAQHHIGLGELLENHLVPILPGINGAVIPKGQFVQTH